jgi:hypothetical protein
MKVGASQDIEKTCRATTPVPSGYFIVHPQGRILLSKSREGARRRIAGT